MQFTATEFKAKCLHLIDQVQAGSEPIIITKHGRIVAKLVSASAADSLPEIRQKLDGSVTSYFDPFQPAVDPDEVEAYR